MRGEVIRCFDGSINPSVGGPEGVRLTDFLLAQHKLELANEGTFAANALILPDRFWPSSSRSGRLNEQRLWMNSIGSANGSNASDTAPNSPNLPMRSAVANED
jgi:hypothetical protein